MGYFVMPGGGTGHTHGNQAVLDALQHAGSGAIITPEERTALAAPFVPPPGTEPLWNSDPPATIADAVARLSILLSQHFGSYTPPTT